MWKIINNIAWIDSNSKKTVPKSSKIMKFIGSALFVAMIAACTNDKKISKADWEKIYAKLDSLYESGWWNFYYDGMNGYNQEYINKEKDGSIRFVIDRDLYAENPQDYGIFKSVPKEPDNITIDIIVHPDGTISNNGDMDGETIYWEIDRQ